MAASSRLRLGIVALVAALALAMALFLLPESESGADAAATPGGKRTPGREMLLRPQDAGRHIVLLDFGEGRRAPALICDLLHPATPPPDLAAWLESDKPHGCFAVYAHVQRHGRKFVDPYVVGSGALDAGSEQAATEGIALAGELLAEAASGETPEGVAPPGDVGDETFAFRWPRTLFFSGKRPPGTLIAWRSGDVIAAVFVEGDSKKVNGARALRFARVQQSKRIEHPSPFPLPPRPGSGK
jgi:hypothetical protein